MGSAIDERNGKGGRMCHTGRRKARRMTVVGAERRGESDLSIKTRGGDGGKREPG